MVCKEDVLLWFKDLEGYKRIDVMFELLNMCVPFEVRFLGSCIEEIGKHSYQELRGSAIIANDIDKLTKDSTLTLGVLDEGVRHRVLIYLSLLSGSNCKCANWFYKTLLRTERVESCVLRGNFKDENLQSELLLLFTMGLHHPAFTFDQKNFFGNMLAHVMEQRESKKHITSKPFSTYIPGFGYSSMQKIIQSQPEATSAPAKTPMMCHGDPVPHQHQHHGIVAHPITSPIELMQMWSRPGFVGQMNAAPEIAPFPPPPASPIVSEPSSPSPSRAVSPNRIYPSRSATGLQPPNHTIEVLSSYKPPVPLDPCSQPNLPPFSSDFISNDEDFTHIPDDKLRDSPWLNPVMVRVDMKPPNGMRFPSKLPEQYFIDQMQALNLDGGNSLHCSSSSSSSTNSSPPDTPTTVPAIPHHGPGRGENKSRLNGLPQYVNAGPPNINVGPPVCDTTPPPHSAPTLSNCSVPYTNYPPQVTLTAVPNRSVFHYTQPYRPPFSAPLNYHPPEIYTYTCPYVPFVFSSTPSQVPHQNSNCFNCGAVGHAGSDCSGQTVEEITQKKAYTLEYNSPLPDADK